MDSEKPQFKLEQPEVKSEVDFKKVFDESLQGIEPLSQQDGEWEAYGLEKAGIKLVKRKGVSIIFPTEVKGQKVEQLWIEDPRNVSSDYPHMDASKKLEEYLRNKNIEITRPVYGRSGYVLQDSEDDLYLFFILDSEFYENRAAEADSRGHLLDLMKRYNIKKLIGQFPQTRIEGDVTEKGYDYRSILDFDLVGEIRENEYLRSVAKKYKMTNNQFMRFRILAKSASGDYKTRAIKGEIQKGSGYLPNLDKLAQEVITMKQEE